jgi:hypothetical protein
VSRIFAEIGKHFSKALADEQKPKATTTQHKNNPR